MTENEPRDLSKLLEMMFALRMTAQYTILQFNYVYVQVDLTEKQINFVIIAFGNCLIHNKIVRMTMKKVMTIIKKTMYMIYSFSVDFHVEMH